MFIAVPGVNAAKCLPDTLSQLNIKKVYEAFDMDKQVNNHVRKALKNIHNILNRYELVCMLLSIYSYNIKNINSSNYLYR